MYVKNEQIDLYANHTVSIENKILATQSWSRNGEKVEDSFFERLISKKNWFDTILHLFGHLIGFLWDYALNLPTFNFWSVSQLLGINIQAERTGFERSLKPISIFTNDWLLDQRQNSFLSNL